MSYKKYRIIDKIKINQSIVKNKLKSPEERKIAYLELKRLNLLKKPGSILKRPDYEMIKVNPKAHKPYEHNYMVYETNKKNNVKVNKITHGKISYKKEIPSLHDGVRANYIGLKPIDKDRYNKDLKYYDFYESNLEILDGEKKEILLSINKIKNTTTR